jgi:hypothetical protein
MRGEILKTYREATEACERVKNINEKNIKE